MSHRIDPTAWAALFTEARSQNGWLDKPVGESLLQELYEITRMAPTSMNCQPARFVFLTTESAKARLLPALMPGNVEKTRSAPVVVIVAYDSCFYEEMPRIWHNPAARDMFGGNSALAASTAFRNGSLQGGYMMLAARGLGLDCGPMSGFATDKVDAEFFPDGRWKSNFLCGLGYGDATKLMARQPRLSFAEACLIL
ncbi:MULTISPECIES: malonic semialdehyde reductase [Burkholderiales]|uniref:Putative NADH dehydrogenase/NAD(P)H nitroreductase Bpet1520 n=1 Tax=Bordetella petrii (strain ATCC BAA-461 / DSM 12804 / CCUG 43448 / CIP 107267 / Se-1111R) TaxID=340100 RepID=A9IG60_BORPD|nr:malonic semialdehyde reductase [Bordetella petrii]CAP41859.1 putative enzyme [Bordetella petrii]